MRYTAEYIDPNLSWDKDSTSYVATAGSYLQIVHVVEGRLGLSQPGALRSTPSAIDPATGANNFTRGYGIANMILSMHVQTDTPFSYRIDISFSPQVLNEEVWSPHGTHGA